MISAKLILVAFLAIQHVNLASSANSALIAELVAAARGLLAPFTDSALSRLHLEIFGAGRAMRSSDIIIFNNTGRKFLAKKSSCQYGGFSRDLFPEPVIPSHSSSAYGIESTALFTGVACAVVYEEVDDKDKPNGNEFSLTVDNPYLGHNQMFHTVTGNFVIRETLGQGNNNQVRYVIQDRFR